MESIRLVRYVTAAPGAILAAALMAACGGGGSATSSPAAPTVTIALSATKSAVNSPVTLTWSSTGATSCQGADAWSGAQATSGNTMITPSAGGQHKYTVQCAGAGGNGSTTATLIVPMPVLPTSYQNKNRPEISDTEMPRADLLGIENSTSAYFHNRPYAVADFTQEGKFSVMAFQTQFSSPAQLATGFSDTANKAYIVQRNSDGNYVDITSRLIPNLADRQVCVTPTYAIVADFNKDNKPDVFVACTGPDYQVNGVWLDATTEQIAFISQPDGTYKKWKSTFKTYGHQCSAGDLNEDGNVDVVCTDAGKTPFTLLGDGRGDFTRDDTRFPDLTNKAVGAIELVDIGSGKLDVFIGGVTQNADPWPASQYNNVLIRNDGAGSFRSNAPIVLPTSLAPKMVAQGMNYNYSALHDVIVNGGYAYILQYDYMYTSMIIRKVNLLNVQDQVIVFENIGTFTGTNKVVPLIKPTFDGYIVPLMACEFTRSDARFSTSACGVRVRM